MSHDPAKAKSNLCKHGVVLVECMEMFDHAMITYEDEREDYREQRFVSVGLAHGRIVVVVWVEMEYGPRLVSCRRAVPHQEEAYFLSYPFH